MLTTPIILLCFIAAVSSIAGVVASVCYILTKKKVVSIVAGALGMPILIFVCLVYWLATMEVDDPAPGSVFMGSLMVLAAVTLIAFLASNLTIKFMSRRTLRNGNVAPPGA